MEDWGQDFPVKLPIPSAFYVNLWLKFVVTTPQLMT